MSVIRIRKDAGKSERVLSLGPWDGTKHWFFTVTTKHAVLLVGLKSKCGQRGQGRSAGQESAHLREFRTNTQ